MPRESKYTRELLEPIVESSTSIGQVLDRLGLRRTGGNYRHINQRIGAYSISTEHFKGQGWSEGETVDSNSSVATVTKKNTLLDEEIFVKDSTYSPGRLHPRMLRAGWEDKCAICGRGPVWNNKPLRLHVDHINGKHYDNRKINLRILCPNCHQQTKTWGSKNSSVELDI